MKRAIWLGVLLGILLSGVAFGLIGQSSANAETYDQMVARVINAKKAQFPEVWDNLTPQYVVDQYNQNSYWLKPLLDKINAKFPKWATPLDQTTLTKYAIVRAWGIAVQAESDCKFGLVRDMGDKGKFPVDAQFKNCEYTKSNYWWTIAYTSIVEQTRFDFDVSPQVFKEDNWDAKRYFLLKNDYCFDLKNARCF